MSIVSNSFHSELVLAEQAKDYAIGFNNPSHIIEKYFQTFDMTQGGMSAFKLFPKQKELIKAYDQHRHNVVTKPRQTGISTTTAAYLAVKLAYATKETPLSIVIIANKFKSAKKFLFAIRQFLSYIPSWFWGDNYQHNKDTEGFLVGKGSAESLTLVNGSIVKALATSPDALRGETPSYLVLDEAAFIDVYAEELYGATVAAVNTGGKIIMISTPNGFDPIYYKTYLNAINKKNGFNIVSLKWYQDPRYNKGLWWEKSLEDGSKEIIQEKEFSMESYLQMEEQGYKPMSKWYLETCAALNHNKLTIARELDVKFEGSAGNVVEFDKIEMQEKYRQTPIAEIGYERALWIFRKPIAGHKHIMGVDVSSGNADDYSTLFLMDCDTGEQIAEFKGKIRPEDFAKIIYEVGMESQALTVVDTTGGYGDIIILELQRMEYPYLYYNKSQSQDHLKQNRQENFDKNKLIAGIKISNKRPQIVGKLCNYIENSGLIIRSIRFTEELKTFVWLNGRADHMVGFNDDIIFAAAIAIWVLETEYKEIEKAQEKAKTILDLLSGKKSAESSKASNQTSNSNIYNNKKQTIYKSSQDPTGKYSWLFKK